MYFSMLTTKTNRGLRTLFSSLLWLLALLPPSLWAQTFDVSKNTYTFSGAVNAVVTDNAGNTYIGGDFTRVSLWSGHGAKFISNSWDNTTARVAGGQISDVVAIPTALGGGWYIGGTFTRVNGQTRNRLARINADGSLHAFDPNMNGSVFALTLNSSGELYAGGQFTTVGSTTRNRLCKFSSSGTLDATFNPNISSTNSYVNALALNSSGELYVGGGFTTVGSTTRNNLCKVSSSGVLDATFNPNMSSAVFALALNSSGELYAGGSFSSVGPSPVTTRNYLCKFSSSGALDATFNPNMSNFVYALALNSSGELYVGGSFSSVGPSPGTTRNYLCKFSSSGTLDATFNPNMSGLVFSVEVNSSGELYVGGMFTSVGPSPGTARNFLCKFSSSGTLDATFNPNMNGRVLALALNSSGELYVGGDFTTIGGSTTRNYLCKINSSGLLDATFDPNMNNSVNALALNSSGELYVGGNFSSVGPSPGTTRSRLCKFSSSGTLDPTFDPGIMNGAVRTLALNSSGELYVGGAFTSVGYAQSTTRNRLCKFSSSGTLDATFNPNMNDNVNTLALNSSGELYVGGIFTSVGPSPGTARNRLCKFSSSGTLDATFDPNIGGGTSPSVNALALNSNGDLYVGGGFTTVGASSSTTRNRLCKFSSNGTLDATFDPNIGGTGTVSLNALALNSNGDLYVGGMFTSVGPSPGTTRNRLCKFSSNGTLDATFDPNISGTTNPNINALALNSSGHLLVGGAYEAPSPNFTVYTGAGTPVGGCVTPTAQTVTGTGAYCAGGTGVTVELANSETGVMYQLKKDGMDEDPAKTGGGALSWPNKTAGTYTVVATRTTGGCTATMTGNAVVTENSLPTLSLGTIPAICAGAMSFTLPYTASTGTPTRYSISGTGFTALTDAAMPSSSPITVSLSSAASGSSIPYSLTVKNANGCVSTAMTGNVTVNALPTITLGTINPVNTGATGFSLPYTAVTGSPNQYSITSGTPTAMPGFTPVSNATLGTSPISVTIPAGAANTYNFNLTVRNSTTGCVSATVPVALTVEAPPGNAFITRWDLSKSTGSGGTQLSFGVGTTGTVSYTWAEVAPGTATGSGTFTGTTATIIGLPVGGIIDLSISPANFNRIGINNGSDAARLTQIRQWGTTAWVSMQSAFNGCSNMTLTATDVPNTAAVTSMGGMFRGCTSFNQPLPASLNTAAVTDMSFMFFGCTAYNQALPAGFNTTAVTNMRYMFANCTSYNQALPANLNTAAVTNMSNMFNGCLSYNQALPANLNTAAVTDMSGMFAACRLYNQALPANLNTAAVTTMSDMFAACLVYNQALPANLNTTAVTNMSFMFSSCSVYNQPFPVGFNTANVTNMQSMFNGATAFNQSLAGLQLNANVNLANFLDNSGLSIANYDATLTAFRNSNVTGRTMGATGLKYCVAEADRDNLVLVTASGGKGWTITDGGKFCPTITTTGTPTAFTACSGTASAQQSFAVSGSNLTANITVTAPTGFEVSTTSGSGFGSSVALTQSGGNVATATVFVRMAATATGTPSGNVAVASTGATTRNVAVSGTVSVCTTPTLTLGTGTNSTNCNGNGSIAFTSTGITAGTQTLSYTKNTVATTATVTVAANGTFTLTGLGAGVYANFAIGTTTATGNRTLTATPALSENVTTNITTGTVTVAAQQSITATNRVSTANVTYRAGSSVTLSPGFQATGNTFQATIGSGGCN